MQFYSHPAVNGAARDVGNIRNGTPPVVLKADSALDRIILTINNRERGFFARFGRCAPQERLC